MRIQVEVTQYRVIVGEGSDSAECLITVDGKKATVHDCTGIERLIPHVQLSAFAIIRESGIPGIKAVIEKPELRTMTIIKGVFSDTKLVAEEGLVCQL